MRDIEIYKEEEFQKDYPEVVEIVQQEAKKFEIDLKDFYLLYFEGSEGFYMVSYALEEDENWSFAVELEKTDKGKWKIIESLYEED